MTIFFCLTFPGLSVSQLIAHGNVPEHPGKCYSDVTRTAYDVNETWVQRGVCVQYECNQDAKGNFVITTHGCIDRSEFENDFYCWIMEGDPSNPYPSCCPTVACA